MTRVCRTAWALPGEPNFRHDLAGCQVRDTSGRRIGTVRSVDGPLERSHLVVETDRGDVLVPLVADICRSVDVAAKVIVIEPPDGLLELNETRGQRDRPRL